MPDSGQQIPMLDNRYICIANIDSVELSAVVSSYFSEPERYVPFFIFPNVSAGYSETFEFEDDDFISMMMGNETATLINNAIALVGGCNYVVFVGLSSHQKSYMQKYFKGTKVNILEVDNHSEVKAKLAGAGLIVSDYLPCKKADVLKALVLAKRQGKALLIDESADEIPLDNLSTEGIIVIEDNKEVGTIVAINYAFSVGANVQIVDVITDEEKGSILKFIQKWHLGGAENQLQKVLNKAGRRIGNIDFTPYKYVTFFTEGLPYSLYIKNCIPCSYVHLGLRPDLFIVNNIIYENIERFHSAVVFSPQFFADEETAGLVALFKANNLHTKTLIGQNATVGSLDFYVPHYPYDILHICSHGGEVDGYAVSETFKDRHGVKHTVEYDEVVGFSPVEGTDKVAVHRKTIFKKFDGHVWRSAQMAKQKYPHELFEDMRKAMYYREEKKSDIKRDHKDRVPTSCAIVCSDSIHQAMFQILASHSSPFIFNNTCWSWHDVATFFLAGGVKGYVGTLWAIGNQTSVAGANTFYANAFDKPIINAVHDAIGAITNPRYKNIYVFWGLHFSTLEKASDPAESKHRVFRELTRSFFAWGNKIDTTKSAEVRKNSIEIINKIHREVTTYFDQADAEKLEKEIAKEMGTLPVEEEERTNPSSENGLPLEDFIEHPVEYINDKTEESET